MPGDRLPEHADGVRLELAGVHAAADPRALSGSCIVAPPARPKVPPPEALLARAERAAAFIAGGRCRRLPHVEPICLGGGQSGAVGSGATQPVTPPEQLFLSLGKPRA